METAKGAGHLNEFEDAVRALVASGATSDEVAERFPGSESWNSYITQISGLRASRQPLACSFCAKTQHECGKLVAGPAVYICDECISRLAAEAKTIARSLGDQKCSFCGKTLSLVAAKDGQTAHICDQCLDLCIEILQSVPA